MFTSHRFARIAQSLVLAAVVALLLPSAVLAQEDDGFWQGTYTATASCGELTGAIYVSLAQEGSDIFGAIVTSGQIFGCGGTPANVAIFIGTLSGSSFTAELFLPTSNTTGTADGTVTGSISGDSLTISASAPGVVVNGTLTKSTQTGTITIFSASPERIAPGGSAVLSWATFAETVTIDQGIGQKPGSGSVTVTPSATTTYTLTAIGETGAPETRSVTVTVQAPEAAIGISRFPEGMLQPVGIGGATDSFIVTNVGDAPGNVTLTKTGDFFTIAPTTFTLAPGAAQVVTITASAQSANAYTGSVALSGSGVRQGASVPVRLLVVTPPNGPVEGRPTEARADVAAPQGQTLVQGTTGFFNAGSVALQGILSSDAPWILPQAGLITIPPGSSVPVGFTCDRSKRPDSASPIGAVQGKLTLRYLLPSTQGGFMETNAGEPTGTVSVVLVDVVQPGRTPGAPEPLASGEIAFFAPGLLTGAGKAGDLNVSSSRPGPALADLKMFSVPSGATAIESASIPSLLPNIVAAFPAVTKTVFGSQGTPASIQLRSREGASALSVSALQLGTGSSPSASIATAVPVFRSDRAAASGERLLLTGVEKAGSMQTNLHLQDVTGAGAALQLEYLDADGRIVSNGAPVTLAPFGYVELRDAVPSGASAVRITNGGAAGARVAAYALVVDNTSGDAWSVVDPQRTLAAAASGTLIMPVVKGDGSAPMRYELFVTNSASTAATVTVDVTGGGGGRRRAVRPRSGLGTNAVQNVTLGPLQTKKIVIDGVSAGYVKVTGPPASFVATGRAITSRGSLGAIGTGLTAIPSTAGVAAGQAKRFTGFSDAAASTVSARTAGTYRNSLVLVETDGQPVSVRATLRYAFSAGSLVSATTTSSREFVLTPFEYRRLDDLAQAIIGPQRSSFGDLRNLQLDIEVTGGGRVVPALEQSDNASGDVTLRTE